MNYKIYLPISDTDTNYVSVIDKDTIRVFHSKPQIDDLVNYTDYYINSHYLSKDGSITVNENYTFLDSNNITDNIWYRNDMPLIMITFGVFFFVVVSIMLFIVKSFFRGFLK